MVFCSSVWRGGLLLGYKGWSFLERDTSAQNMSQSEQQWYIDHCMIFNEQPSAVSLVYGLNPHPCLAVRKVGEAGKEANVCFTLLLSFHWFRNAPHEHHLPTNASLCLRLFTASWNVTVRHFWRGGAASYLTNLPMKTQTHSFGPQRHT